ncbi:MAG: pre-peptidase C-terminal domain-containing protein, partial [Planctomycetes bacterium]|nr:pre-peptidase C-terminal domain-containing protein [Planctomycetota bacterium]
MLRLRHFRCLPAIVLLLYTPLFAAPPKLNSLFPAGAQRGQTVAVAASGSFDHWPVKAWVDRTGAEITPADEKGKLSVKIAPEAVPGIYWIRLYDEEGATSPRPFIVGTIPEILEQEPNDDPRKPQMLESSVVTINGRLEKAGDVDTFALSLHQGQTLVAAMEANRTLGSPMDASVQIVSAAGFVLQQNDDYHDLDPQVVFTAPADGTYLVRTFAFPATPDSGIRCSGSADYVYRLTLTTAGFVDYAYPLAVTRPTGDLDESSQSTPPPPTSASGGKPGAADASFPSVELFGWNVPEAASKLPVRSAGSDEIVSLFHADLANLAWVRMEPRSTAVEQEPNGRGWPQELRLPVTITGRIDPVRDEDVFRFQAKKGDKLIFRVESRALGFPLDPFLRLMDSSGKTLTDVDDSGGPDAELAFSAPVNGQYHLMIRDLHGQGGERYVYRLSAVFAEADFSLKLAADAFTLTPGKPLEIPVTIERTNGFAEEIAITATELPEGVMASPVKSLGTGDSAKS